MADSMNQQHHRRKSAWLKQVLLVWCVMLGSSLPAQALTQEMVAAGESIINGQSVATDKLATTAPKDSNPTNSATEAEGATANTLADSQSNQATTNQATTNSAPAAGNITEKDTVIETSANQVNDADIKKRISGIYSEIEGLKSVIVSVNQGVVSLTGEAPNEKKAQQAINLANRVSDVVAVEDRISRTLDVQDNVTPLLTSLKQQTQAFIKALPLLLVAIVVFAGVVWFGSWLSRRDKLWLRITPNPFVAELMSQTIKVVFVILGLIVALSLLGAEAIIGTLLGGAGVVGIAVGFAVKDTIENYIASLMLSVRQPFQARDFVQINDKSGIVVRLTSRATILMTQDGNQLRIPNSEVFKATILNFTKNPDRRFDFKLGVDANDDPIAAIKVGLDAINKLDFILKDPKAVAIIDNVGDSNIVLEFQVWVNQTDTDLFKARSIAIREAKHALEDTGFSLPEPIYKLRFDGGVEEAIKKANAQLTDIGASKSTVGVNVIPSDEADTDNTTAKTTKKPASAEKQRAK
ncbi:mechanosensitive ion channel domain-containing protein, partial [Psychrobacter sp.]|uniref:mechanosensitive ion channel domain-containing protein n=1 Tax=Psychrobacter sp. TaxID=56811 RepID=UPI0025E7AFD0